LTGRDVSTASRWPPPAVDNQAQFERDVRCSYDCMNKSSSSSRPDFIIVGQVTVDDVVPAWPGPWTRQVGGSSLYALAGARLWLDPGRIGLVARVGRDYPFALEPLLRGAGLTHIALAAGPDEHPVEWLIYEPDGSRRSLPRNRALLEAGENAWSSQAYDERQLAIAPTESDVPDAWLPAEALHLCPQAGMRHRDSVAALREYVRWISVDPSPHYSLGLSIDELAQFLHGAAAFLPSAQQIRGLLQSVPAPAVALNLHRAGFPEVLLRRGKLPMMLVCDEQIRKVPVASTSVIDATGAGDAFCGAYAACRVLGCRPFEAANRAAASAALVVACSGVEAALQLTVSSPAPESPAVP
jgi:sugar/nucleoside kinase (ribokinase family)